MNAPMPKGTGLSDKLCGNPLAWRLKAGSRPELRPHEHDLRSGDIPVEHTTAFAAVYPFGKSLALDRAAIGACLACSAWMLLLLPLRLPGTSKGRDTAIRAVKP